MEIKNPKISLRLDGNKTDPVPDPDPGHIFANNIHAHAVTCLHALLVGYKN